MSLNAILLFCLHDTIRIKERQNNHFMSNPRIIGSLNRYFITNYFPDFEFCLTNVYQYVTKLPCISCVWQTMYITIVTGKLFFYYLRVKNLYNVQVELAT